MRSESQQFDISATKTALLEECKQFGSSQLLNDPMITREESLDSLLGEIADESSITNLAVYALEAINILGTNIRLTSEFQMSDSNLKWLKEIIP